MAYKWPFLKYKLFYIEMNFRIKINCMISSNYIFGYYYLTYYYYYWWDSLFIKFGFGSCVGLSMDASDYNWNGEWNKFYHS